MKKYLCSLVLMVAFGLGTMVAQTGVQADASTAKTGAGSAQDPAELSQKVEELEGLVKQLQSEITAMKQPVRQGPRGIAVVASTTMPMLPAASLALNMEDPPAAAAAPAPAAPEKVSLAGLLGPTTLSGFVDVFYGYNSNQPANRINAYHNFDINSSEIGLNMMELVADKSADTTNRVGYHIALGFGQAMNQINATEVGPAGVATEPNFGQNLKEAYLEYMAPIGKGLQINVGKFVTPAGAEVIETKDNWNYTRGLLFAWAIPYFHTGVSAKYAFNSKFALTGYLVNGWNNSTENNSGKTTGFTAAYTPNAKFSFIENYLVGPEASNDNSHYRKLSDTVITYNPNAKLSFMANYDYGHDFGTSPSSPLTPTAVWWSGIAGYIKYAPNDKWAFATRGEWFNDHNGFETAVAPQHLSEFTFTLQRMLAGQLMSRLEFRRDMSNQNTFPFRDGSFGDIDHQNTLTLGLVYAFSSANAK